MEKMVKIVLITVLVALPALGTYVKTTLPPIGSAPDPTIKGAYECIESGNCQNVGLSASVNCKNTESWSEFVDPITGGVPYFKYDSTQDFPINFLFNAIPINEELSFGGDITLKKRSRQYLIAGMM